MLHKSFHIYSKCVGISFKYGAQTRDEKSFFKGFDPLCTTSAEVIEKVIAFSSVSTQVIHLDLYLDQMGKGKGGDIPLKRKGATGGFKHTEVMINQKLTMVQYRKSVL